ncbi:hypothetical protein [Dactylosporangium sp. NPDC048998]|uniref:hypothetical protein n=1 Tax=Dactylosporangium sp. NPDC048998 TaxID=3363976 RepID=UPI00371EFFE5
MHALTVVRIEARDDADMGSVATIISAAAATVAALLAGLNLVVSGRREQAKWAREALVEVLVGFIDASFDSKDIVKRAIRDGTPDSWPLDRNADAHQEAKAAEHRMRHTQSRLRLLAPPAVVDAAQQLRIGTRRYLALLDAHLEDAQVRDAAMRAELWHLRQRFLNEAKAALALPRAWRRAPTTAPSEAIGRQRSEVETFDPATPGE